MFNYKKENEGINSNLNINIPKGKYSVFIRINETIYNMNLVVIED